jgi:small subunit ribosomal protein S1
MENEIKENGQEQKPQDESNDQNQPGWFLDFVDHYDVDSPKQGEMLNGTILDISENSILLDVGFKRDAIITSQDLDKVDEEITSELAVGDEVYVSVIRTPVGDDDLLVSLSRGLAYKHWVRAEESMEQDETLELKVIDKNRGGVLVEFESLRGFVPNSHIPNLRRGIPKEKSDEMKAELIGQILPVKVIEVNRDQRRLVFSARIAQQKKREERLQELEPGMIINSRVVNVVDFGLFVDLVGVDGLVHKSEIDWDRVYDPSKHFNVGDEIEVKVVDIDVERERVSLSRKALLPNPWEKLASKYKNGDLVEGKVVSVLDFGAFVELPEGLQGLVHVSEIGYANMGDPKSVVKKGDKVLVRVLGVEPERERISLSMRRVPVDEQMAWMMEEEEEESVEGADLTDQDEEGEDSAEQEQDQETTEAEEDSSEDDQKEVDTEEIEESEQIPEDSTEEQMESETDPEAETPAEEKNESEQADSEGDQDQEDSEEDQDQEDSEEDQDQEDSEEDISEAEEEAKDQEE